MKKRQELATQMQIEAVKDVRGQIDGSKLKSAETVLQNITKYTSKGIDIGYCDFSLEYFGTFIGGYGASCSTIFNQNSNVYQVGAMNMYTIIENFEKNVIDFILFEKPKVGASTGDSINLNYKHPNNNPFHVVVTRQGKTVKAYINGVLKATKEQSEVKDMGTFSLGIANTSDFRHARIFNYALSQSEVTALYNNGKPEEYVISGNMRTGLSRNSFTSIQVAGSTYNVVEGDGYKDYTILTTTYDNTYPRLYTDRLTKDFYDGYIEVELDAECFDENGFSVGKVEGISYSSPENLHVLVKARAIYKFKGKVTRTDSTYGGRLFHSIGSNISSNIGKTLRVYSYKVTYCSVIAEYLPQNLISTNDGVMNSTTATKWLDSAKQLPDNDEYLEPLLESIGGYDLTASGEPEIVYKPNVILKVTNINLYDLKPAFASNQTDAYYQFIDNGMYINTGNYLPSISRPSLAIRYPSIIGRSYKIEVEYSSLYGNMKLDFINIDGTTNLSSTNLQYIETGESYRYTSEITKRIGDGSYFNLYFKNSIANSEMLISKIIIYEYQ